jgi:hypothetical protein
MGQVGVSYPIGRYSGEEGVRRQSALQGTSDKGEEGRVVGCTERISQT